MQIVYARQDLPSPNLGDGTVANSIFLVGPTPRSPEVPSWRPAALEFLRQRKFGGTVFVPEDSDWGVKGNYDDQVWWEIEALGRSRAYAVWLDRRLPDMPGFTTNVEFGMLLALRPKRLVLGVPDGAEKARYLETLITDVPQLRMAFNLSPLPPQQVSKWDGPALVRTMDEMVESAMWIAGG